MLNDREVEHKEKKHKDKEGKKEKKDKSDQSEKKHKDRKDKKDKKERKEKGDRSRSRDRDGSRQRKQREIMKGVEEELDRDNEGKNKTYVEVINGIHYKVYKDQKRTVKYAENTTGNPLMIEVIANDRMGNKTRVKCSPKDTVGELKKLISAHTGNRADKIRLQRGTSIYKDHITLEDYGINHGGSIDMYYN